MSAVGFGTLLLSNLLEASNAESKEDVTSPLASDNAVVAEAISVVAVNAAVLAAVALVVKVSKSKPPAVSPSPN